MSKAEGEERLSDQLRKRLGRERAARLAAERIAERGMRDLYEKQQQIQLLQTIAVAANEATTIEDALQVALDAVCAHTGWPVGHAYILTTTGELVPSRLWHLDNPERFAAFRSVTEATSFPPGIGLPGRVLESGRAAWIIDVNQDANFPRAKQAIDIGVKAGFGFPVLAGSDVVAVLEFYSAEAAEPDERLLSVMIHIGTQVGRVVERQRAQDTVRFLAYHDALTGLPNRALFEDRFSMALGQAARSRAGFAVLSLDLDRFKLINDTLGHTAGDQLLREASKRLLALTRDGDTLARVGGDEFMVLLAGVGRAEEAAKAADRILSAFRQPFEVDGREFDATTSIGISFYPHDGEDAHSLVRNADAALYRAKELGRGNYQLYTPAMNVRASERLALERDLRHAWNNREFVLYYQPQWHIETGQMVGVEALLRWDNAARGIVLPGDFIPVAEETGLIVPLGEWVLSTACAQIKTWQDAGHAALRLAVNLSMRQFQQPDFVGMVERALAHTGLGPRHLELEITESIAMQDTPHTSAVLGRLRALGVRLSIDDFGTGYSSLRYLKDLPIDALKIDQSFIRDLAISANDATIASNIIAMGHSLNLRVTAEGVETPDQLAFLKERHCDEFQGFLSARPMPAELLTSLLVRGAAESPGRDEPPMLRATA